MHDSFGLILEVLAKRDLEERRILLQLLLLLLVFVACKWTPAKQVAGFWRLFGATFCRLIFESTKWLLTNWLLSAATSSKRLMEVLLSARLAHVCVTTIRKGLPLLAVLMQCASSCTGGGVAVARAIH